MPPESSNGEVGEASRAELVFPLGEMGCELCHHGHHPAMTKELANGLKDSTPVTDERMQQE